MSCGCDGDLPQVSRESWHIARKEHKCCECKSPIIKGERHQYVWGIWEGQHYVFKTCLSCTEVRKEVYELTECWPAFGEAGCCYAEALREC